MSTEIEVPPKKNKRIALLLWSLLGLTLAAVVLLAALRKPKPPLQEAVEKAVPVRLMTVEAKPFDDRLSLPARLEARYEAVIPAEKPGMVAGVEVDRGDRVEQGQLLACIDDALWTAARDRAAIESVEAEKEWTRWTALQKTGAVSGSDFDALRARRDLAAAALHEANVHVAKCAVRSPLAGRVEDRFVERGEYATEGMALFRVVSPDPLTLRMDLPEQEAFALRVGDPLPFVVFAPQETAWTGTVSFVAGQATPGSHAFRAEALVPNPDGALKAGLLARATISRGPRAGAIVIPLAAVLPRKGEHVVFLRRRDAAMQMDRAERRVVTVALMSGHDALIAGGLTAGEEVIVDGQRGLADGMRIEVLEGRGPESATSTETDL